MFMIFKLWSKEVALMWLWFFTILFDNSFFRFSLRKIGNSEIVSSVIICKITLWWQIDKENWVISENKYSDRQKIYPLLLPMLSYHCTLERYVFVFGISKTFWKISVSKGMVNFVKMTECIPRIKFHVNGTETSTSFSWNHTLNISNRFKKKSQKIPKKC